MKRLIQFEGQQYQILNYHSNITLYRNIEQNSVS